MATSPVPVKSKPLHNFSLQFLKWGETGTAKSHNTSAVGTTTSNNRFRRHDHEPVPDDRLNRVGSRPARTSRLASSPTPPLLLNNDKTNEVVVAKEAEAAVAEEAVQKPWKLRPRKPALTVAGGASRSGNMEAHGKEVPVHGDAKSTRLIGTVAAERQCSTEKKKKRRFLIALSKEEIEEDIFVITGSKPNRRPKKRPRNVQKQMDSVFPGLWLVGATADSFKVVDTPAKR